MLLKSLKEEDFPAKQLYTVFLRCCIFSYSLCIARIGRISYCWIKINC